MRKYLLLYIVLFWLPMVARGQTITDLTDIDLSGLPQPTKAKVLRYWFDDDAATMQTTSQLSGSRLMDVSGLIEGLHTLHYQVIDTEDGVAYIGSGLFLKVAHSQSLSVKSMRYWFDDDDASVQTAGGTTGTYTLDVANLIEGLHTLHYQLIDESGLTAYVGSSIFLKIGGQMGGQVSVNSLSYWFDDNQAGVKTLASAGTHTLDVSALLDGLHTIHYQVKGSDGLVHYIASALFLKVGNSFGTEQVKAQKLLFWFDDETTMQKADISEGAQVLDASTLLEGLHTLHYQVLCNNGQMTPSMSTLFLRVNADAETAVAKNLRYWFDDEQTATEVDITEDVQQLDASGLIEGLHTVHYQIANSNGTLGAPYSSIFLMINWDTATSTAKSLRYWFDDETTVSETTIANGAQTLDAARLIEGLHTVHYQIVDNNGTLGAPASAVFLKMDVDLASATARSVRYWFDDDASTVRVTSVANGSQTLDVSALPTGLHTLNYQLIDSNGRVGVPVTRLFLKNFDKVLAEGGNRVTKYQYWQNGNTQAIQTVTLDNAANPYKLIALLPVQKEPIQSSQFHFELTDGVPAIYAKNTLHIRFHDAQGYSIDGEKPFVDYSVKQEVTDIERLEPGRATTAKPAENIIKWYSIEAHRGDSLAFRSSIPCTLQLFSPSGKERYQATGTEVLKYDGCYASEEGTYYLALHDVTAKAANSVNVDYQHIDKYAILEVDVDEIGLAPSIVPITIHGNGYDKLRQVSLTLNGDTIQANCMDVLDKATVIAMFTLKGGEHLGAYTLNLEFEDEEDGHVKLSLPNRIHLAKPVWGEVAVDVTTARTLATPYPVHIKVQNTGNVARLYTPLTIAFDNPNAVQQVNMDNFFINKNLQDDFEPVVWTDNFGGTGKRAEAMYLFIPTLAPSETKDITLSYNADSHAKLNVYAESGESANDKRSIPKNSEAGNGWTETGQTGSGSGCTVTPSLWEYLLEHTDFEPSQDLLDNLEELDLQGLAGRIVERAQQARQIINNSVAIGRLIANIVNGARHHVYMATADNYNVDDDMREMLHNAVQLELPSTILNDAGHPVMGGMSAFWEWQQLRSECSGKSLTPHPVEILNAGDPNNIFGYTSESGSKWMREGVTDFSYTIEFENDPEIATASAHTIVVCDTLDAEKFDLATFAATNIKIGNKTMWLDGEQNFLKRTVDLRPEVDVVAQVSLSFNQQEGIAMWTIESLDPMTMEPTEDAMQGALPVNTNGKGVGEVSFDIRPKSGLAHGTEVNNRACIVFDQNEPIMTPTWTNIIDRIAPVSSVADVAILNDSTATVAIDAFDNLSGCWRYDVYVQYGEGSAWWKAAENVRIDTTASVKIYEGIVHGFYVVATDSAGNVERKEAAHEYTLNLGTTTTVTAPDAGTNNATVYDLQGRKQDSNMKKKEIYVVTDSEKKKARKVVGN